MREALASHRVRRYLVLSYVYVAILHVLRIVRNQDGEYFCKPRLISKKNTQERAYSTALD